MDTQLAQGKISPETLNELIQLFINSGYKVIGPQVKNEVITLDEISSLKELPQSITDKQEKGYYRITSRNDNAYFGYNIGHRSFKEFLFPPKETLYQITKQSGNLQIIPAVQKPEKLALLGIRACELNAIYIQDKVFSQGAHKDPKYTQRRQNALLITLNCATTTATCFCASMNTGPEVKQGYDINLTEILTKDDHYFIIEAGSTLGKNFVDQIKLTPLTDSDNKAKAALIKNTTANMGRKLDTHNIKELLHKSHDHPHWETVADRCLNCANCTLACPTCFCSKTEESIDLDNKTATHTKSWDSCFSQQFSYIHNSLVRESPKSRYRQWFTHKLGTWHDQFDSSGCVGCGRCITWCPVGIDITEEILKLKKTYEKN